MAAARDDRDGLVIATVSLCPFRVKNLLGIEIGAQLPCSGRRAIAAGNGAEAFEAARALIDTVVVSPPDDPGGPAGFELTGNLMAMLEAGGASIIPEDRTLASRLTAMLENSGQGEPRRRFPSPDLPAALAVQRTRRLTHRRRLPTLVAEGTSAITP